MKRVLEALNTLVEDSVIKNYAIGGAIGASFYVDALQTEDVDAFVFLPDPQPLLLSLAPIYTALRALGGIEEREYMRFGEWPLQILTDADPLTREAIEQAVAVEFDGVRTRVFRPEHLCAIALQTGRKKDLLRVRMFLEQQAVDLDAMERLAVRFGLSERWSSSRRDSI